MELHSVDRVLYKIMPFCLRARIAILIGVFLTPTPAFSAQSLPTPSPVASASPATPVVDELPTIVVPARWTAKDTMPTAPGAVYVGAWNAPPPDSPADEIALGYVALPSDKPVTIEAIAQAMDAAYKKLVGIDNMIASHAEKVCAGTADGWYLENKVAVGTMNVVLEQTILLGKTRTFVATYGRLDTEKEDPAARAALDTICVKGSQRPAGVATGNFDLQYDATLAPAQGRS
jgi:hypothetical protein